VDECKPLFCGDVLNDVNGRGFVCPGVVNRHEYLNVAGRGLLSSTLQLNLSRSGQRALLCPMCDES